MEKYELENRENIQTNSSPFVFPNYGKANASNEINAFHSYITSASKCWCIETLMKETMQVVTVKKNVFFLLIQNYLLFLE